MSRGGASVPPFGTALWAAPMSTTNRSRSTRPTVCVPLISYVPTL